MRDKRKGDKQNTFYWHFMIKVRIISEKCMLFLKMQLVEVGGNFLLFYPNRKEGKLKDPVSELSGFWMCGSTFSNKLVLLS